MDQGAFQVRLELEEGTALDATAEAAVSIESAALNDPGVAALFSNIGRDVQAYADGEEASGLHTATFQIRVADGYRSEVVAERMREEARVITSYSIHYTKLYEHPGLRSGL